MRVILARREWPRTCAASARGRERSALLSARCAVAPAWSTRRWAEPNAGGLRRVVAGTELSTGSWARAVRHGKAQHPIAHDLQRHAADLSRFGPGGLIIDRRQSQKAASLIGIPRALRQSAELGGIKVRAERDGNSHGDLQTGDRLRESYLCPPGNPPHESTKLRLGISGPVSLQPVRHQGYSPQVVGLPVWSSLGERGGRAS